MNRKCALILNFTANTYHWGCYGTCLEIYQQLLERGYYVNWLDVRSTHNLEPRPAQGKDFTDPDFAARFFEHNKAVYHALTEADVVVVNGEGTLHRLNPGPVTLLYLMYAARCFLGKPVHLINHSFFPSGSETPDPSADTIYGAVASVLTRIVPRETASAGVLRRLGLSVEQGFDCLPLFIARHRIEPASFRTGPVVLAGGISIEQETAERIARVVSHTAGNSRPVLFLTGAKARPAGEDATVFAWMSAQFPGLQRVEATSMSEWLQTIATASCLVSGRFHHTIAAAMLGTPLIVLPSNTPKVSAVCDMLDLAPPLAGDGPQLDDLVAAGLQLALDGSAPVVPPATCESIRQLATNNFAGL
jgi:polysaccharide pyruvyl transferase WcaK-like protein